MIKITNPLLYVLVVLETWLPSDCLFNLYNLSGINMVISESTKKSNVVAIYIDEAVAYEVLSTPGNLCFTSLTVR